MMIDARTLYANNPGFDNQVSSAGNVAKKSHHTEAANQNLPVLAMNVNKEKDSEVSDTSGIINEFSQVASANSTTTAPILPTTDSSTNLVANLATPPTADSANDVDVVDPGTDIPLADPPIHVTVDDEQRVEISETATFKERSDPSLG